MGALNPPGGRVPNSHLSTSHFPLSLEDAFVLPWKKRSPRDPGFFSAFWAFPYLPIWAKAPGYRPENPAGTTHSSRSDLSPRKNLSPKFSHVDSLNTPNASSFKSLTRGGNLACLTPRGWRCAVCAWRAAWGGPGSEPGWGGGPGVPPLGHQPALALVRSRARASAALGARDRLCDFLKALKWGEKGGLWALGSGRGGPPCSTVAAEEPSVPMGREGLGRRGCPGQGCVQGRTDERGGSPGEKP